MSAAIITDIFQTGREHRLEHHRASRHGRQPPSATLREFPFTPTFVVLGDAPRWWWWKAQPFGRVSTRVVISLGLSVVGLGFFGRLQFTLGVYAFPSLLASPRFAAARG
jgi:hypothetical protein